MRFKYASKFFVHFIKMTISDRLLDLLHSFSLI